MMHWDRKRLTLDQIKRNIDTIRPRSINGMVFVAPTPKSVTVVPVAIDGRPWKAEWVYPKPESKQSPRGIEKQQQQTKEKNPMAHFISHPMAAIVIAISSVLCARRRLHATFTTFTSFAGGTNC
jgi:hypothetical protein